ncbi:hypothetical protein [Nocardia sp. bgisy134]|uniref:hypothetical protein n=1 Tax=unclassified Nocardia TaxID=2637762 RepID=UPI003D736C4C
MRNRSEGTISAVPRRSGVEHRRGAALRERDGRTMNSASAGTAVPSVDEVSL